MAKNATNKTAPQTSPSRAGPTGPGRDGEVCGRAEITSGSHQSFAPATQGRRGRLEHESDGIGLPKGWLIARLREVTSPGGTRNPQREGEGIFRYVDIDALDNTRQQITSPKTLAKSEAPSRARMSILSGDIIFSLVRPYLKNVAIVPTELDREVASTAYCVLRPGTDLDSKFLFHQLLQDSFIHSVPTYGSSPPSARDDEFLDMLVRVAPASEQRRIVAKIEELFSDLDAGVAALERVKAKLRRYRAAVLKAAVEGRLTAEWRAKNPAKETGPQLLDRILRDRRRKWDADQLAAFEKAGKKPPAGWKDKYKEPAAPDEGSLPALPDGWCWASVEKLLVENSCNGVSVKGSNIPPGVPALRLSAMGESGFDYAVRRYIPISEEVAQSLAIKDGDFFVARGNGSLHLVGRGTLAQPPHEQIVFPDTMIRLRLSAPVAIRRYIAAIWPSRLVRGQIERRARTTAGIYKISQRDVDRFVVPLPPLQEQEQIVAEAERCVSIIQGSESQIDANLKRSARLRQSILKRAFEGKLVPQDPNDEPASAIFERINQQRNRPRRACPGGAKD